MGIYWSGYTMARKPRPRSVGLRVVLGVALGLAGLVAVATAWFVVAVLFAVTP
jgi:hypothetical protein